MTDLQKYALAVVAVSVPCLAVAEEEEQASRWHRWESHLKIGTQTYVNELDPDPGSAGLTWLLIGYRLSNRSMIGASYATAGYEITYFDGRSEPWGRHGRFVRSVGRS